jgi:hypothetical protein
MVRPLGVICLLVVCLTGNAQNAPADLADWNRILGAYYDPAYGFDYEALKAREVATLDALRQRLARVNVETLEADERLAHWINVYNINTVATVVEHYPVESIRDISTDFILRLNVFKKPRVQVGEEMMSLDEVEHEKIREPFHEPRIHFAINCAARTCPPLRTEAYRAETLETQLEEQTRKYLGGPRGLRFGRRGDTLVIHAPKIMDWFRGDFERWGGGTIPFIKRYVSPGLQQIIDDAQKIVIEYDDYDWDLNDWKR